MRAGHGNALLAETVKTDPIKVMRKAEVVSVRRVRGAKDGIIVCVADEMCRWHDGMVRDGR